MGVRAIISSVFAALSLVVTVSADAQQVPEIPVPNLGDIAVASLGPQGPVIYYDPYVCQMAGPACEFFRAHEYGHVVLGHLQNQYMMYTPEGRAMAEAQADCFGAQNSSPLAVQTVIQGILHQPPDPKDAIYGSKQARAQRIASCAGM